MPNRMKPETLEETRSRLQEMSAAERRGFDAVSEGQLIPLAESPADPDGPEQELHQLNDALRLRRSIQDRPDEESVQQTQAPQAIQVIPGRLPPLSPSVAPLARRPAGPPLRTPARPRVARPVGLKALMAKKPSDKPKDAGEDERPEGCSG